MGCDDYLGSGKVMDKCGVCGGDNTTCRLIYGVFKHSLSKIGYHKIVEIPEGATKINVTEMVKSRNYLGRKKHTDHIDTAKYISIALDTLKMSVLCSLCHITHLEALSPLADSTAAGHTAFQKPSLHLVSSESTFPRGEAIIDTLHSLLC